MSQSRLKKLYNEKIVKDLRKEFKLDNDLAVPKVTKVVVSVGITEEQHQDQALQNFAEQLKVITGQKPKITQAKKSIAGFKLRAGDSIGLMVTLRGNRMYQFIDKLFSIVLPRVKDFQGVKRTAFDKNGNYSLGIEEQIVFPEIEYGKIDKVRGLQVTFVTNTHDSQQAEKLLEMFGMPFVKEEK
ncbi:50S ribosomal protein L5 [Patescibacteria group bacterium]